jgi:hypothetical protein
MRLVQVGRHRIRGEERHRLMVECPREHREWNSSQDNRDEDDL